MSVPTAPKDTSLSAASFLASISAESSTSFGSSTPATSATSAPSLPVSAKVSLIDAQIDALEGRIEQAITAHATQLRERAASTRSVEHDLNKLWRSINQTSSRLVTVGPKLAPIATDYHEALAQSSKQGLLISFLSDLIAATRHLEKLEKLQQQSDLSSLRAELPKAEQVMLPFRSKSALQDLPAVVELKTRFERLEKRCQEVDSTVRSVNATTATSATQSRASLDASGEEKEDKTNATDKPLSPALQALEKARALIVARGSDGGWKEVRIELDAPVPPPAPPSVAVEPPIDPSRSSFETVPERLLRDDIAPESASLTRNSSSSSSAANARNRPKPKLGARVIRPQDQLGSGPFNAEDTPLEDDGWRLDDDVEEEPAPPQHTGQHISHISSSSSAKMQPSISASSSQRSAFSVSDDTEADAWDLEDADDASQQPQSAPKEAEAKILAPSKRAHAHTPSAAWGLEDDVPEEQPEVRAAKKAAASLSVPSPKRAHAHTPSAAAWGLDDDDVPQQFPSAPIKAHAGLEVPGKRSHAHTPSAAAWDLAEDDMDEAEEDPWEPLDQPATATIATAATATEPPASHSREAAPVPPTRSSSNTELAQNRAATPSAATNQAAAEPFHDKQQTSRQTTCAAERAEVEEPEEEAWGFEDEPSGFPEADQTDSASAAPMQQSAVSVMTSRAPQETSPNRRELTEAAKAASPDKAVHTVETTPKKAVASQAHQPELAIASPRSSPGWGEDFSFSEPQGICASDSFSSEKSLRSTQRQSKAQTATRPQETTPALHQEECTISKRSVDFVNLAESTMSSVISMLQSGAAEDDVEALANSVFKIFELHRALMPVVHGEVLRDVPSLAMQFFNDCEYLARELTRLLSDKGETISTAWFSRDVEAAKKWKSKELPKLEQEAISTRALGQRWFEAQLTSQTKILLDTLMEADGFARTFDDHRFARCERCTKQVVHTLQQLSKAWRPVLVPSRFFAALGRLVDLVFQKVLHDVLDLEDIGEKESEKLASLVKTLGSLESLFVGENGESAAALWVPSWFKTSYLIEILTGSLVDIEFLAFEVGALVDYSRKELTGLIKALFADTVNRSKLLRRIEGAPVEVLAH